MEKSKNKITISITDFIGFVNKSGGSKMTKVKQLKNRENYHPSKDFLQNSSRRNCQFTSVK